MVSSDFVYDGICESILGKKIVIKFGKYLVRFVLLGIKLGLEVIENLIAQRKNCYFSDN